MHVYSGVDPSELNESYSHVSVQRPAANVAVVCLRGVALNGKICHGFQKRKHSFVPTTFRLQNLVLLCMGSWIGYKVLKRINTAVFKKGYTNEMIG